ncbi:uncharacterized protein LOC131437616 [Malaya genurostris]|uniref:uncharacterized protein LOC131437616 n=1 Tax=Malaya genurostris TaxID=325434 RepID=UPI0026F3CBDF|nr:uncharacterized protein LOC131437616 [Malaya genurostris]
MCEVETGVQILQRISSRLVSDVKCLDPSLFPNGGPNKGEMVEIVGESNCGKSCLILELIAKIILPVDCGGQALGAVFINCDNNINMIRLLDVMEKQTVNCSLPATRTVETQEIHDIRQKSLARLTIITCFTLDEFELTMLTLSDIFIKNPINVYLLIDSIVAFYWSKCTEKTLIRMDTYLKSLHTRLKKLCQERKVITIYTQPAYFGSGRESGLGEFVGSTDGQTMVSEMPSTLGASSSFAATAGSSNFSLPIEHRIELAEVNSQTPSDDEQKFNAFVYSKGTPLIKFYMIDKYGINWLN